MSERFNVLYPRRYQSQGKEQVHWMKVGAAWENTKQGGGFDVQLWVTPPVDASGAMRLLIRPPLPEDQQQGQGGPRGGQEGARAQHRDQLGPQQRGGYAEQGGAEEDLPF